MGVETYRFVYDLDNRPFLKKLAEIDTALAKTQAGITKTAGMLKTLGQNAPGLSKYIADLKKLDGTLKASGGVATTTEKALAGVGKGNTSVTSLDKRVAGLTVHLTAMTAEAIAAAAAIASIPNAPGGGGRGGGGGGGGNGGGGGSGKEGPGFVKRMVAGIGQHVAYAAFRKVTQSFGDASQGKREFFTQAADIASEYRKDLQEVAVLNGKNFVGDAEIAEDLAFQKATNLNAEESKELRLEFGGAVAPGKLKGNIDDRTAAELEKEAARFGLRYELDMKTTGRMAGLLGNYGKVPSAAEGVGQMAASAEQLNVFGLGSVKGMMSPMIGLAADMLSSEEGGRFKNFEEMAARFGNTTFQAKSAAGAGTQIRQANRLLRKFNGGDEEAFLRGVGITPEDDYESSLRKIAPKITGPDGDLVLMAAGFDNSTERDSVIKQARMNGVVDKQLADPRMAKARANAVAANSAFANSEQGLQRAGENAEFAATVEAGLGGERLKAARAQARASLIRKGELAPGPLVQAGDMFQSAVRSFGGVGGRDLRVDDEAVSELERQGRAVGIDVSKQFPRLRTGYLGSVLGNGADEGSFQAEFDQASGMVDAAKKLKQAGGLLNQAANGIMRGDKDQGGPPPGPVGNGGGGVNPGRR